MYERNPFSSSSYVLFLGTKKNSKEATIRGTPFHTVLDLSSNCEVACSLFWKQKKRTKLISTACLRPFQKAMCFSAHPRDFCVGDYFYAKRETKKRILSFWILFWAWQKEWNLILQSKAKQSKRIYYMCISFMCVITLFIKTVCAAPSGPPLVSSTGDAGWTESTFFGSRCWLMSDPKKDVAC